MDIIDRFDMSAEHGRVVKMVMDLGKGLVYIGLVNATTTPEAIMQVKPKSSVATPQTTRPMSAKPLVIRSKWLVESEIPMDGPIGTVGQMIDEYIAATAQQLGPCALVDEVTVTGLAE